MITRVSRFTRFWRRFLPLCWLLPGLLMAAPGSILWTRPTPRVIHGPVLGIVGTLYIIAASGTTNKLMALSEQDGQVLWSIPLVESVSIDRGGRWESLSAGPDGTVYVSAGKALLAYSATGRFLFRHTITDAGRVSIPSIGYDGSLYIALFRLSGSHMLRCLSANGRVLWTVDAPADDNPSEAPVLGGDGSLFLGCDRHLMAFSSQGKRLWSFGATMDSNGAYMLAGDGTVLLFDAREGDGKRPGLYALDPLSASPYGTRKWFEPLGFNFVAGFASAAIGPSGMIFCMNDRRSISAFSNDGTLLWMFDLPGEIGQPSLAVGGDGAIYLLTDRGFYAISRSGKLRWRKEFASYRGPPVISKSGAIYLTASSPPLGEELLWAIDTGVTSLTHPWPLPRGDYRRSGRSPVVQPSDRFSRSRILPDSRLELLIEGPPSHLYSIERSATMKDWHSFTNGASSNGVVQFLIPAPASSPAGFFRVAKP